MAQLLSAIGWTEVGLESGSKYYWCPEQVRCQPEPPLYEILGLSSNLRGYNRHAIFKAYQERMAEFGSDPRAKELLVEAYKTLSDPIQSALFDRRKYSKLDLVTSHTSDKQGIRQRRRARCIWVLLQGTSEALNRRSFQKCPRRQRWAMKRQERNNFGVCFCRASFDV
ncbi:unnamed protein product [Amoebophrya sp. A25]|nr:unnamed protein product [Amoebophrya sp. A25]|eukprot:GSA25T00013957001.1